MTSTAGSDPIATVDDVLITAELTNRPSRAPDYEIESQALGLLAQEMAGNPRNVLQKCAELVLELCHADSAGISVLEPGDASDMLRWQAAAGAFAPNLNGTMPREASPCGTVMERNCILLFNEAERFFPALRGVEPRIYENLLAPWHVEGKAVGTLWAIKHTAEGRFDAEDARILQSLARFAAAAFQMISALDEATAERSAVRELEKRQSFLLELSDALRTVSEAREVQAITTRLVGTQLEADRVMYAEVEGKPGFELGTIHAQFVRQAADGDTPVARFPDHFTFDPFGAHTMAARYRGDPLVVRDVASDAGFGAAERAAWQKAGVCAAIVAPLSKGGRLVAEFGVHSVGPRDWTTDEVALVQEVAERTWAAVERARAETVLRESEARLAQDLEATQVLQNISNKLISRPGMNGHFDELCEAARVLMRSDCASIQAYDEASSRLKLVGHVGFHPDSADFWEWVDAGVGSACGRALSTGERVIVPDIDVFEANPLDVEALHRSSIFSVQSTPLVARNGEVVGMMSTHWHQRNVPTDATYHFFDILARLAADFIVRVRAEAALRESEERFLQFANASRSALWIRDAETFAFEFVSPSVKDIYGVAPEDLMRDERLLGAVILPEEREEVSERVRRISNGETIAQEYRILRATDRTFRWVRSTGFPLYGEKGKVERIGGIAEDVTETKMAVEHQGVLLAELQHRVRNIMAMIRSTAVRSADGATGVEDYKISLAGRLLALSRVQTLLTRHANAGGSLRGILESEIGAQAHSENQYELTGPDIMLSPKAVEVLTLAFHELSTNALRYGALSVSGGKVTVTWTLFEKREKPWLAMDWAEDGAPSRPPPTRRGFGSELIEGKIPYELRGSGKTTIEPGGAHCHIEFPLREAESILETDAPAPTRLYGGTVDMTGAPDLTGKIVLVVEDDYYVASDTAAALRGAGAEVLGPCPTEE
jgi:PAS domain S-box-containing protein